MKKCEVISIMAVLVAVLFVGMTVPDNASAQSLSSSLGVVTYPSKGQSAQQQSKDEGECYAWAKQQTGLIRLRLQAPYKAGGSGSGRG